MKRYYSHFTFIYPDIYLKNHIVEMDSEGHIIRCFPFEKEIEKTEFYSGLLAFIPKDVSLNRSFDIKDFKLIKPDYVKNRLHILSNTMYYLYNESGIKLN